MLLILILAAILLCGSEVHESCQRAMRLWRDNLIPGMLLPMILIIVFMFILIYLPQKRQDKKDAAMRSSIEIGDKVSTIGGIVGIVCAISEKDDTIVLETGSDRTKIRFRRTAISSVEKLDMGGKDATPAKK